MREILFRGKKMSDGRWVYGDYHKFSCTTSSTIPAPTHYIMGIDTSSKAQIWVDPATVGQYTGLTDKNGVKIFEGDIIQRKGYIYPLGRVEPCRERIVRGTVTWMNDGRNAGYWAIYSKDEHGNQVNYIFDNTFAVIGNVYDNQELLNES